MENKKDNSTIGFIFYAVSVVLSLASILVYRFLPVSEFANGIEHSGAEAVRVLLLSPVSAVLAVVFFAISFIKLQTSFSAGVLKKIQIGVSGFTFLGLVYNFVASLLFFLKQNKLGFVAPVYDTVWETLLTVMAVFFAVQCILLIFEILCSKGIIKMKA